MKTTLILLLAEIGLIVWPIVCLIALILIVRAIAKYLKRKDGMILLLALISLVSCRKETSSPAASPLSKQQIVKELGFTNATVLNEEVRQDALSFSSLQEAKEFFRRLENPNVASECLTYNWVTWDEATGRLYSVEFLGTVCSGGGSGEQWFSSDNLDLSGGPCEYGNVTLKRSVGWSGYITNFSYTKKPDGKYDVSNYDSNVTGFHLGIAWEHKTGNVDPELDADGNLLVTITGVLKYVVVIESVGTVFTQHKTHDIKYNPCTGAYSMKTRTL